jgi:uncharacterized protein
VRPLDLGSRSSDEYRPLPRSDVVREAERRAIDAIDRLARHRGMSRRDVLRSSAASAIVLAALGACSREERGATNQSAPGGTFTTSGVTTTSGTVTTVDVEATVEQLDAPRVVVDAQLHFLDPERNRGFGAGFPQAQCGVDPDECFSEERFLELVFAQSSTATGVLSALPILPPDDPLSLPIMDSARASLERMQLDGRRLHLQAGTFPGALPIEESLAAMDVAAGQFPIVAWKTYTHAPGSYRLDDERGLATLRHGVELGVPVLCVHKGIAGGDPAASPDDVGPAAAAVPDATIVVYHSGWEPGVVEGAFDAAAPSGIDRLLASLDAAGIPAGGNVVAELGSTWFNLARSPDEAAHALGKLLTRLGPGNVIWGTDSIWYGSPQGQIDALVAFEISTELQERFGYPALTAEVKDAILGANARRVFALP